MNHYVDVHTHLTHPRFAADIDDVIARANQAGLDAIVVNGLEPQSNRQILELAAAHPTIKAACGIYPVDAVNDRLPADFPWAVTTFDVDEELSYIRSLATEGKIIAVGECGIDGHWLGPETYPRQEEVFESLIEIAIQARLPIIVHTRKLEKRAIEILTSMKAPKVNFHCFCGRSKLAISAAQDNGWYFSIPTNARRSELFQKLLQQLPSECILTETDAPFLAPERGCRNEPANVVGTVGLLAELRGWDVETARGTVWANYCRLFGQN